MRKGIVSLAAVLIFLAALVTQAQPENDFIGTWKMDAARSQFSGDRSAPNNVEIRFAREAGMLRETIKVVNSVGETSRIINYSLDGSETINGSADERIRSRIIRRPDAMILEWIDEGRAFTRTLKLSSDRRTLSIKAHDTSRDGQKDDLIVLERQ